MKKSTAIIASFVIGIVISLIPVILVPHLTALIMLIYAVISYKKLISHRLSALSALIIICIPTISYFLPFKYEDTKIDFRGYKIVETKDGKGSGLFTANGTEFYFPNEIVTAEKLGLPMTTLPLREALSIIESNTGYEHLIRYCGEGGSLLFGQPEMSGILMRSPNKSLKDAP